MNMQKLSINKVCVLLGTLLLLAVGTCLLYTSDAADE